MGEVVNLNKFRKAKDLRAKRRDSLEQRARHGRSKSEREQAERERLNEQRLLDDKRLKEDDPA